MEFVPSPDVAASLGAASDAVVAGSLIFCSAQIGMDRATGRLGTTTLEQTRLALTNLVHVLREAGAEIDCVIQMRLYMTDIANLAEVTLACEEAFVRSPPATTLQVKAIAGREGLAPLVGIEAIGRLEPS